MTAAADQTFRDVVREADRRGAMPSRAGSMDAGGVEAAIADLSRALGLEPGETRDSIEQEFFAGSAIAPHEWTAIAAALAQGGKTDAEQARRFGLLASLPRADRVADLSRHFLHQDDRTPRKTIVTKAIKDAELDRALERGTGPRWRAAATACAP